MLCSKRAIPLWKACLMSVLKLVEGQVGLLACLPEPPGVGECGVLGVVGRVEVAEYISVTAVELAGGVEGGGRVVEGDGVVDGFREDLNVDQGGLSVLVAILPGGSVGVLGSADFLVAALDGGHHGGG